MNNAGNDLWPKLLVQYSKTGHKRPLPMVEGKFISKSTTAVGKSSSSGSSGTSAGTSKSTSAAPTRVRVTSYIADGQLCYAWGNTVDERSYANEWVSVKDSGGQRSFFTDQRVWCRCIRNLMTTVEERLIGCWKTTDVMDSDWFRLHSEPI